MIGKPDRDLLGMTLASGVLILLSLTALFLGRASPPFGKSDELLNGKALGLLLIAMPLAAVTIRQMRALRYRFVAGAFLLHALVVIAVLVHVNARADQITVLLVVMLMSFSLAYAIGAGLRH